MFFDTLATLVFLISKLTQNDYSQASQPFFILILEFIKLVFFFYLLDVRSNFYYKGTLSLSLCIEL